MRFRWSSALIIPFLAHVSVASAQETAGLTPTPKASTPVKEVNGEYFDANGDPTYKIDPNGMV